MRDNEPPGQFSNEHLTDGAERKLSNWRKIMQSPERTVRKTELLQDPNPSACESAV